MANYMAIVIPTLNNDYEKTFSLFYIHIRLKICWSVFSFIEGKMCTPEK